MSRVDRRKGFWFNFKSILKLPLYHLGLPTLERCQMCFYQKRNDSLHHCTVRNEMAVEPGYILIAGYEVIRDLAVFPDRHGDLELPPGPTP